MKLWTRRLCDCASPMDLSTGKSLIFSDFDLELGMVLVAGRVKWNAICSLLLSLFFSELTLTWYEMKAFVCFRELAVVYIDLLRAN